MPAIAALTINDGQTVPVSHTFSPQTSQTNDSPAVWLDRSPTIPAGYKQISLEVLPPSGNRTVHRASLGFKDPKVATVDSVDTVVRFNSGSIVINIHPDSTLQERKDILAYMANALDEPDVVSAVLNLEPAY